MMGNIERKKRRWEKVAVLNKFCIIQKFIILIDMYVFKLILNVVLLSPKKAI